MPGVRKLGIPTAQKELEEAIREQYGNMLSAIDVGRFLGLSHHEAYEKFPHVFSTFD